MNIVPVEYTILAVGFLILWAILLVSLFTDAGALAQCQSVMSADECTYIIRQEQYVLHILFLCDSIGTVTHPLTKQELS